MDSDLILQSNIEPSPEEITSTLLDVDHINSYIKHTEEGEQPSNYQLVCKQCHILKSYDEKDFIRKDYR